MTVPVGPARVPSWYRFMNPITRLLVASGVPMGNSVLLTVRGRMSGRPRTTPLMLFEHDSRRWVTAPYGEVHWVRNLRAAGRATLTARGRKEEVLAVELGAEEAVAFFRDIAAPFARRMPFGSGSWIVRDIQDPGKAAAGRPVFELRPARIASNR